MRRSLVCLIIFCSAFFLLNPTLAQENLTLPNSQMASPGAPKKIPDVSLSAEDLNTNSEIFSSLYAKQALAPLKDAIPRVRGVKDVALFKKAAPSVVLILTKGGLGSGSLLSKNVILTNAHVVRNQRQVIVVFKPRSPNGRPTDSEIVKAKVIKTDRLRDLALLRLSDSPPYSIKPLELSDEDSIDVGTDVAAIGHPTGEAWTYTKGIVSQFRPNYEWKVRDFQHRATVIQTQTPINPGNSGGPLLSEDGKIVGVNSFAASDLQGLNFAVAAKEVRYFLNSTSNDLLVQQKCEKAKIIFEGRNKKDNAFLRAISLRCDDTSDIVMIIPDDKRSPIRALVDWHRRGKTEGIVFDPRRSGKWESSFWDPKLDETFPLKGIHKDGQFFPVRFENRCPRGTRAGKNLKCVR